jgi:hypothetical protein
MQRLILMALLLAHTHLHAQKQPLISGKPFPYTGSFITNSPSKQTKTIESYRGKYLLLNLFGSICGQAFEILPRLDSFNRKYKSDLSILLIGLKDYKIESLYDKYREYFNLQLEVSIDSIVIPSVKTYFLPTFVWIDTNGLIKGVSGPDKVTPENIERFISGQALPFENLSAPIVFDNTKDYLNENNDGSFSKYLLRSMLGKWDSTLPIGFPDKLMFSSSSNKFSAIGLRMADLYRYAYFGARYWGNYGDSLYGKVWIYPIFSDSAPTSLAERFCFSASYQGTNVPDLSAVLKSNLQQYFGYRGRIEKRLMPYYSVTIKPDKLDSLKSKGGPQRKQGSHASINYQNVTMDQLLDRIAYYFYTENGYDIPILNQTDLKFNVDVKVEAIFTVRKEIIRALNSIGIVIELKQRMMDVLVLSQNNSVAPQ